jgi:Phytanoyl-CoA dioxygenase (PhyH)
MAGQIEDRRRAVDQEGPGKSFIMHLLPTPVTFTPENDILARFAVQGPLLAIANAYYGMRTKLQDANIWHTFRSGLPARDSQLWHRDGNHDRHILKAFVYLSEVDEGAGPFTYSPGTHAKGDVHVSPVQTNIKKAWRTTDEQMAEVVPPERWVKGMGPRGTIVLADTRGYHKGGECRDNDRILYHCMFTSPTARLHGGRLARPADVSGELTAEQQFALA